MISGNTFALVLPEANKKEALEVAEKIRKKIQKLDIGAGKGQSLTASAGVSENPLDGGSFKEIYDKAEVALKKAKEKGKNKVVGAGA